MLRWLNKNGYRKQESLKQNISKETKITNEHSSDEQTYCEFLRTFDKRTADQLWRHAYGGLDVCPVADLGQALEGSEITGANKGLHLAKM